MEIRSLWRPGMRVQVRFVRRQSAPTHMAESSRQAEEFVSEAITPSPGAFDTSAMSRGEPGLPGSFTWRGKLYTVARVVSGWKSTGKDRGETYLRRHWYAVETTDGSRMTLYCERQA